MESVIVSHLKGCDRNFTLKRRGRIRTTKERIQLVDPVSDRKVDGAVAQVYSHTALQRRVDFVVEFDALSTASRSELRRLKCRFETRRN